MQWTTVKDYEAMSQYGAERIFQAARRRLASAGKCNLGLATGNTMLRLYELLAGKFNAAGTDLRGLRTFNLDEYVAPDGREVPADHPLSYRAYMRKNLFSRLAPERGFPDASAFYPPAADSSSYDRQIAAAGGLGLQLLGIGFNGHIAFNEPLPETAISVDAYAELPSRIIDLTPMTIATNARLTAGNDESLMPRQAVTMGLQPILAAAEILLLACFPEQAAPLRRLQSGLVTPELPASYLHRHPRAEIVYTTDVIALP